MTTDTKIKTNFNGHKFWRIEGAVEGRYGRNLVVGDLMLGYEITGSFFLSTPLDDTPEPEAVTNLRQAWETNTPLETPVPYDGVGLYEGCDYCESTQLVTDGFTIWAPEPCPRPNGIELSVNLEVPSGVILVANDLRQWFPGTQEAQDAYVNNSTGIEQAIKGYAEDKLLCFFVGNSCPGVYPIAAKDAYVIANPDYEDEAFGDTPDEWKTIPNVTGPAVADVCTDLWWVCMVDEDEAKRRGFTQEEHGRQLDRIEVTPGTYTLDYYGLLAGFDRDADPVT